jgi:hypothetical protein
MTGGGRLSRLGCQLGLAAGFSDLGNVRASSGQVILARHDLFRCHGGLAGKQHGRDC